MGTPKKNAWRAIYPNFLLDFAILIWESRTHDARARRPPIARTRRQNITISVALLGRKPNVSR